MRGRASYVLKQGSHPLRPDLVRSTPATRSPSTFACTATAYGSIALEVDDAESAYRETVREARAESWSRTRRATSTARSRSPLSPTYGDTIHSFVERGNIAACFCRVTRARARPMFWPSRRPEMHRSHGRQRRLGRDEPLGPISTRQVMGFQLYQLLTTRTSAPSTPR